MQSFNESGWDWFLKDSLQSSGRAPTNALAGLATLNSPRLMMGGLGSIALSSPTPKKRPNYLESWAAANFGNELQKPFWTDNELVAILLGIDPFFARREDLAPNRYKDDIATEGMRLHEIVQRANYLGELSIEPRPYEALDWALERYIHVPPKLLEIAAQRNMPLINYSTQLETVVSNYEAQTRQLRAEISKLKEEAKSKAELVQDTHTLLEQSRTENEDLKRQLAEATAIAGEDLGNRPVDETKSASATTRCYRMVCKVLFVVVSKHYGFCCSGPKWNKAKLIADLAEYKTAVDDATILKHLRAGSEEYSR